MKIDVYDVIDSDGNVVDQVRYPEGGALYNDAKKNREAGVDNIVATGVSGEEEKYTPLFSGADYAKNSSITMDKETGRITIKAPKDVISSEDFSRVFDKNVLNQIAKAYTSNHDYKLPYTEVDPETGEEKEATEITIPEYIEKQNATLSNYLSNFVLAKQKRGEYRNTYGDKANNMSDAQIRMSVDFGGSAIPIPEFMAKTKWFESVYDKIEGGYISLEDLKEAYNRESLDREDMASILGMLDAWIQGSDWSAESTYEDESGEKILDRGSANEIAKAIAFRNYILSNDPDAKWYQAVGDNLVSAGVNAAYGTTRIFANILNLGEGIITRGAGTYWQDATKSMDETVAWRNETETLVNDATRVADTLGFIGGTLLGAAGEAILGKWIGSGVSEGAKYLGGRALGSAAQKALDAAGVADEARKGLSLTKILEIAEASDAVSRGALFMLRIANTAQKAKLAVDLAKLELQLSPAASSIGGWVVEFLKDTVHDALLYDTTTLREALAASDEDTRNYWMGQLAENGKWWAGMGVGKTLLKTAGKTAIGQSMNALFTKYINRIAANVGDKWANVKDRLAGGDLLTKLQSKYEKALDAGKNRTAKRISKKIDILNMNQELRNARRSLGDVSLEWDGPVTLTKESAAAFVADANAVRHWENAIDSYHRSIEYKRQQMLGRVKDPYTGYDGYINPTLGGANNRCSQYYFDLGDLCSKHGISATQNGFLGNDVIDYQGSLYDYHRYSILAQGNGERAAEAQNAADICRENLSLYGDRIPDEIKKFIDDNYLDTYTDFYREYTAYGKAHKLLDKNRLDGYDNETWDKIGYQPSIKMGDKPSRRGIDREGEIAAVIEQEMGNITYNVKRGQHYVDQELIRQGRINRLAQAEVNVEMLDAYVANTGAAFTSIIGGDETEYVRKIQQGRKDLEKATASLSNKYMDNFDVEIKKAKNSTPLKRKRYGVNQRATVCSSFSFNDTEQIFRKMMLIDDSSPYLTSSIDGTNFDGWYSNLNKNAKAYVDESVSNFGDMNYANFRRAAETGGQDFEYGLRRAWLSGDDDFAKSAVFQEGARNYYAGREAFYEGVWKAEYKDRISRIPGVATDGLIDDLAQTFERNTDDYLAGVREDPGVKKALEAEGVDSELLSDVIILKRLKNDNIEAAKKSIWENIEREVKGKDISQDDVRKLEELANDMFDDYIDARIAESTNVLKDTNMKMVDEATLYDEVKALHEEIIGMKAEIKDPGSGTDIIMYLDGQGRQSFAKVDPAFASLYNHRYIVEEGEAGIVAKVNAAMSKAFRYGTTSVNLASFGNQLFRDFGNAVMIGGAWHTIKTYADEMVDVFGQNVVDQIKRFDPDGYEIKQLSALAEEMGVSVEKAAISRELMTGAAIAPSSTERTLYKELWDTLKKDSGTKLEDLESTTRKILDKYNPEDLLNGTRENYLRNRVFAANYNDGLKKGYTVSQSRVLATFAMNNATTNFGRKLYHLQAIADSTPYFSAAINGTKSFWRMWALDPVGISGRITGGLIIPTIALVGASLSNEEDKKVYKNIPEYAKEDSLVFVIDGQAMSIPMPQELSAVVAPFRQFVEYLNDANENDYWELMMSDLIGISPIDLSGFSAIDMNTMTHDPTLKDRIDRGFARVFSQVAPVPVKTLYMLGTGTDPYTGKDLNDPSYAYWDGDSGSVQMMDYSENTIARVVASTDKLGKLGSAAVWEKVFSGVFGNTGTNVLNDLVALFSAGPDAWLESAATNIATEITKPITVNQYDLVDSLWRQSVRQLTAKKNAILQSDAIKVINDNLKKETDPEKREKLLAERKNYVSGYIQEVADMAKRLSSEYEGTMDRYKFAAVIQLLNFNTDSAWQEGSQYSSNLASDQGTSGYDAALQMAAQIGVDGAQDMSIFGYATVDRDGNPVVKYSTPSAILDLKYTWYGRSDYHVANIEAILSENGIKKKTSVDEYYTAKNAGKEALKKYKANWNKKVVRALEPYMDTYTAEAVLDAASTRDALDDYIFVDNLYKAKDYLYDIFGVGD